MMSNGIMATATSASRHSRTNMNAIADSTITVFCATSARVLLTASPTPCTSLSTWVTASPACSFVKEANGIS